MSKMGSPEKKQQNHSIEFVGFCGVNSAILTPLKLLTQCRQTPIPENSTALTSQCEQPPLHQGPELGAAERPRQCQSIFHTSLVFYTRLKKVFLQEAVSSH